MEGVQDESRGYYWRLGGCWCCNHRGQEYRRKKSKNKIEKEDDTFFGYVWSLR